MTASPASTRALIDRELPSLVALRRDLHAHPELCFEENRTSGVVQRELSTLGIVFKAGLAHGTGVVAHLAPSDPADAHKPAVALRADMDALPITERTGKPYASTRAGVMHACGHDGHTTILIGAARVLSKIARPKPVTLVFQPAEEGGAGGEKMCQDGALAGEGGGGLGPPVARMYGLHCWPLLALNKVACRPGPMLAAVDDFIVDVEGTGGHAAYPHLGSDPIVAAAHVITGLQTIASRNVGPLDSVVCTVGQVEAGTANNIIPSSARLVGTVRTLRAETRKLARERFFGIVENTCRAFGCRAKIRWHESYPVTTNDAALADDFADAARATLGAARYQHVENPTMGGEDFAYYARLVPACFFFLGLKPESGEACPTLHQPDFDFNDDALITGIEMMVTMATREV